MVFNTRQSCCSRFVFFVMHAGPSRSRPSIHSSEIASRQVVDLTSKGQGGKAVVHPNENPKVEGEYGGQHLEGGTRQACWLTVMLFMLLVHFILFPSCFLFGGLHHERRSGPAAATPRRRKTFRSAMMRRWWSTQACMDRRKMRPWDQAADLSVYMHTTLKRLPPTSDCCLVPGCQGGRVRPGEEGQDKEEGGLARPAWFQGVGRRWSGLSVRPDDEGADEEEKRSVRRRRWCRCRCRCNVDRAFGAGKYVGRKEASSILAANHPLTLYYGFQNF